MNSDRGLTKGKKIIIISMMSVIAVFLLIIAIIITFKVDDSRTIMIYMSGTNLETDNGLATADLSGIVPEKIDLEKNNVLLYTGGTKRWHNDYISSGENAIFQLTKDGFVKVKKYDMSNMSDDETLTTFLNYGYDNYKTGKYDLILWDHGGAIMGSIQDDYNEDFDSISLYEFDKAFKASRFNSNNKLETIIFRTCLNGTFEMATVLSPYAEYMVASEEITRGASSFNVLGFLNNIKDHKKLNGKEFGELFIDAYKEQMKGMEAYFNRECDSTYSIINLSKISGLMSRMNSFFAKVDADKNYKDIARVRSTMHQYAKDSANETVYDTVDLYELVDNLKMYSTGEAESLKRYLKNDVVLYNWSTNSHSNGLSIYFPYYGTEKWKEYFFTIYDNITVSNDYKNFITVFNDNKKNSKNAYTFSLTSKDIIQDKKEFKIKLSNEEQENYTKAGYIIFNKESDGYFTPIYRAEDATLDKDGYLTTNITNRIIKVIDENTNEADYFTALKIESNNKKYNEYTTPVMLYNINVDGYFEGDSGAMTVNSGNAHFIVDNDGNVRISDVYIVDESEDGSNISTRSTMVDIDSYTSIMFTKFRYKILDENGNYTTNWESNKIKYLTEVKKGKYHFETASLDEGDYYCVFAIFDSQDNVYYSDLISIK